MKGSVCIIGGGITGLTAANRLRGDGASVTLFESGDGPGGVIRTTRKDGFLAEHGPNSILLTSPVIMEVIKSAGLNDNVVRPGEAASTRYIVRNRKPVALPASPGQFLTTPLFTLPAKLRLLAEPFIGPAPGELDESLGDFVRRRIGREFLDYAINPFVAGVYAGDPEKLSVRHSFPKLHALEQKYGSLIRGQLFGRRERKNRGETGKNEAGMISLDRGLQLLTDTLAARVGAGFIPGSTVKSVTREAGKWSVRAGAAGAHPGAPFDAVLYTGPAHALTEMEITGGLRTDFSPVGEIVYPPVSSLVLGFPRESVTHPLDGFGVLIPEVEPYAILGVLFSSSLFEGRAPAGHVTLTCFLGGTRRPSTAEGLTGEVVETAMQDLRKLLGVTGEPVFVHHSFYGKAIPQYNVGYGRYLELMKEAEVRLPGFFIAGSSRDGISLGNSIVSGFDVAGRILEFLRSPK
jgi:oxygen-dependent protoporphyrinogen oxidase